MEPIQTIEHRGRQLQIGAYQKDAPISPNPKAGAPGSGNVEFLKLQASHTPAGLNLQAQLNLENIAYLYTELFLYDAALQQYYGPLQQEHLHSAEQQDVQGLTHPVWQKHLELNLSLAPRLRILSDGVNYALACMQADDYAQSNHHLDGLFTPASTGKTRRARLIFNSAGELTQAISFQQRASTATPRELKFKQGDLFQPFLQILQAPGEGQTSWHIRQGLSNVLTWHGEKFTCLSETPMPGEYLLGLVAQDYNGARFREYKNITISA